MDTPPETTVDAAIVRTLVPQLYDVIDDLLDALGPSAPKELAIRARRLLPADRRNAFKPKQ